MRVGDSLLFLSLDEMINDQTTIHTCPALGVVFDYVVNIHDKKVNLQSVLQS